MAAYNPQCVSDMVFYRGVGEAALDRYGEAFLAVIHGEAPAVAARLVKVDGVKVTLIPQPVDDEAE